MEALTAGERRVLQLIADGLEVCEIAARLGISESAVRSRLHRCMRKTGQASSLQATLAAIRAGWVIAPALADADVALVLGLLARLLAVEDLLEQALDSNVRLRPDLLELLGAVDAHLAARHWDEPAIEATQVRIRQLVCRIQGKGAADASSS